MSAPAATPFVERMLLAARLDDAVYEEVEHDQRATVQAALVVVLGSIAAGLGGGARLGLLAFVVGAVLALGAWSFYAWIAYFVGGTLFRGPQTEVEWGQIARTLGFANSPRLVLVLNAIPGFAFVALVVWIWTLATTVLALRAALDCTTGRALFVAIVSSIVQIAVTIFLVALQASS